MSPKTEQSPKTGNVSALESGLNQVQLTPKTETGLLNKKVLTEDKNTDIVLNQKMHDQMQKKNKCATRKTHNETNQEMAGEPCTHR